MDSSESNSFKTSSRGKQQSPCCPPDSLPTASAKSCGATGPTRGEYLVLNDVEAETEGVVAWRGAREHEVDRLPTNKSAFRAYITRPSSPDVKVVGAILVFHDIFGFNSARAHHVADDLAEFGYVVIAPDFFDEDEYLDGRLFFWPPTNMIWGASSIVRRGSRSWQVTEERLMRHVVPFIRSQTQGPIGILGFCWGGWAMIRAAELDFAVCGASPHPSAHTQKLQRTGDDMDTMFLKVKIPLLLAPSRNDPSSLGKDGYYMKLLQEKSEYPEARKSIGINYPKMLHGWANRGDISNASVREGYEDFVRRAAAHYAEYLGGLSELSARA